MLTRFFIALAFTVAASTSVAAVYLGSVKAPDCCCTNPQAPKPFVTSLSYISQIRDKLTTNLESSLVDHFRETPTAPFLSGMGLKADLVNWSPDCNQFISSWRKYGPYGKSAIQSLSPEKHPNLFSDAAANDMGTICPAFAQKKMNPVQKEAFWIWFAAATAMSESSCKAKSGNPNAPEGTAYGLFQLHKGQEQKYPVGAPASDQCKRGDSRAPTSSIACFFKMQNYYIGKRHNVFSTPGDAMYFQVHKLKGGGAQATLFKNLMKQYTPCQQ
jgi:hypothetical protein